MEQNKNHSKIALILVSILAGVIITLIAQHINKTCNEYFAHQEFNNRFDRDISLFDNDSFFKEMENAENRMNALFESQRQYMIKVFDEAAKNGKLSKTSISTREDKDNYYYELNFSGFKKEDIKVDIKNGVLTFAAENKRINEEKDNGKKPKTSSSSSFSYSFSLPKYDTNKEPEITKNEDKITVKFSKDFSK